MDDKTAMELQFLQKEVERLNVMKKKIPRNLTFSSDFFPLPFSLGKIIGSDSARCGFAARFPFDGSRVEGSAADEGESS